MYWDTKTVLPLSDYKIYVEIANGQKGVFDLKPYLNFGVFKELSDINYFNQVYILFGAVTWPHEQDIAPETLLSEMKILTDQFEIEILKRKFEADNNLVTLLTHEEVFGK